MFEMTVRLDRELRNTVRRLAEQESAATKEQVSIAQICRMALRDFAARRQVEVAPRGKERNDNHVGHYW